ncbi:MAG: heme ABC transporter ATP-binding protein [Candidatus Bathyarchaeota archaeon]|nr:heme ABC transporter ATP-binding protein [Candidatus Termiticorpusculum sp.]
MKLTINNLSFSYAGIPILKDIALNVELGELVSIVGPNGSGKSTLLKCVNRILKTGPNSILLDGKDASKFSTKELSKLMGYVPQTSISAFPFTVYDVVMMGRKPYVHWSVGEQDNEIVVQMMDLLGISHLAMRQFSALSGGEQQKVIIARALAQQPQILLLDEPTSSLDIKHQLDILCILKSLAKSKGHAVIVTLHDLNLASRFSDRLFMLKRGRVYATGTPEEVLTAQNIEEVYEIKTDVSHSITGKPVVTPIVEDINLLDPKMSALFEEKMGMQQ